MTLFNRQYQALLLAMVVGWAASVLAQSQDTAYVPFVVNVNAIVKAELETVSASGGGTLVWQQISVAANKADTLRIPLVRKTTDITYRTQRQSGAPAIVSNKGGRITLNLPGHKNADISLNTIRGKQVLRKKLTSSSTATPITGRDIAAGVYLLSIRGAAGYTATSRLTHSGGGLTISVIIGGENLSTAAGLSKSAADGNKWTIKINANGWADSTYAFTPIGGTNPRQAITLRSLYPWVKIGEQTWTAKNINEIPATGKSWCYDNADSNCVKYGRLYDWKTALTVCPSSSHLPDTAEWNRLLTEAGGGTDKLRTTSGWNKELILKDDGQEYIDRNGTDVLGFSALPGGYYRPSETRFFDVGRSGRWWTATTGSSDGRAYSVSMFNHSIYSRSEDGKEYYGSSIRCILD